MENLVFWGCVAVFLLAAIGRQIFVERKKQREFEGTLRTQYGQLRKRVYGPERLERIDRYFRKHPEADQLDDITWNDLGMDAVFQNMNHTYSAIGEEYLYHTLRSVGKSREELHHLEELISYFAAHEEQRVFLQLWMAKLGYMGKYSLYDYLDHLDDLGERSNVKNHIGNALLLPFVLLLPFQLPVALFGIAAVLVRNVLTYYTEKGEIEPYVVSFSYLLKLLEICKNLEKLPAEKEAPIREELLQMEESRKALQSMKRGSFVLFSNGGVVGGNPLEIIWDYLRIAFHVDLIQFNRMYRILKEHVDAVDALATGAGRLETAVAIGAWRAALAKQNGYCVPRESGEQEGICLRMEQGYHPLLTAPVKNTVIAKKGVLLTGSNASGKSTFLKTCAINAILAQTVHTCAAQDYEAPLFRIYSSMALRDDLAGGDSYYIVEIKSLKRILTAADSPGRPVLCFVDEVLRGTNTVERIAASTQILGSLGRSGVLCFAATHDIELTDLLEQEYENYHFEEQITQGDLSFPYRLIPGKASSRNAIRLLEILGYDSAIIQSAERMAESFLKERLWSR